MVILDTWSRTIADLRALDARQRNAVVASYLGWTLDASISSCSSSCSRTSPPLAVAVAVALFAWFGVEARGVRFAGAPHAAE